LRIPAFSLRASVIAQLGFLILAAMMLCDVVMIRFAERDLVRARVQAGRLLARSLEGPLANLLAEEYESGDKSRTDAVEAVRSLLEEAEYASVFIVDRRGKVVIDMGESPEDVGPPPLAAALQVLRARQEQVELLGRTWAVIWPGPEWVRISVPASGRGRTRAGISVTGSLVPLYRDLRTSQKFVLLYILLDTAILALAGMALLARVVVRPIRRLLKMTEDYTEGDFLVTLGESSGSEIRQLSRSLSHMIRRLEENKTAMREHIDSLELANEELRKAQNEVFRSEKLASVGRLAAGIAHEIGNPIGIILGYLELMARPDLSESEKADCISRIETEIARIHRIIRTLLDFSRASEEKREQVSLHGLIRDTLEMLQPQAIMEGVMTVLELEAQQDVVFADPGRMQQVFLNILMNAGDVLAERAAPGKGEEERTIWIRTRSQEGRIEVRIADNGLGIADEDLSQVFDPFYTTKDPGKGTGLGLSVSHRIVEDLGGGIRILSTLGEGTTVIIELPLEGAEEKTT
jgi:two-component system, NtrC family, sensor kinase